MSQQKIKIALILNGSLVPAWIYEIVKQVAQSELAQIVLALIPVNQVLLPAHTPVKEGFDYSFLRKYLPYDKAKYPLLPNAFAKVDVKDLIGDRLVQTDFSVESGFYSPSTNALENIKRTQADLVISLVSPIMSRNTLPEVVYGTWHFKHGDQATENASVEGAWEFILARPETKFSLMCRNGASNETSTLYETYSSTDHFGIFRNRNNYLWKAPFMIVRALRDIEAFPQRVAKLTKDLDKEVTPTGQPRNKYVFKGLFFNYFKKLLNKWDEFINFEQYILLFKFSESEILNCSFSEFTRIMPPKDRFWADPFVIKKSDAYYIFIEELIYEHGLGTIGVIKIEEDGSYGEPQMVLEKDYHLSYPFLIEDEGILYMVPETKNDSTIQLYKCVDFPLEWKLQEIIMDGVQALDTTIFLHEGKYWMFTNIKEHPGISAYDELFLFHSDTLVDGNWIPHPKNPIVSDVRSARPAGAIFQKNGKIYRPAQNCAKRYGHGMQISEIITLTETDYEERAVRSIFPDWASDLRTTHTINNSDKLTVIDALVARRK
ncbi:hypothetical protein FGM00_05975 [Aggregatimonas sangjinii]|uniref:Glucosamine inositolphosphorylceramide transferase 1 N-terminal domain-containing protein n=1 Tax=Aggregatimonas sangjinii TaxID=2583587 RepID=A0A5B7SRN8_9FLAO|nr:hypothetical protein [Aggregatimonas sangjinii]QCW99667.1 hypothetical protein FGM00_05975 [Aggregatimonas sangjinii]